MHCWQMWTCIVCVHFDSLSTCTWWGELCQMKVDWLIDWLTGWLIDWLIDWLVDWLIGWLTDWLITHNTHISYYWLHLPQCYQCLLIVIIRRTLNTKSDTHIELASSNLPTCIYTATLEQHFLMKCAAGFFSTSSITVHGLSFLVNTGYMAALSLYH